MERIVSWTSHILKDVYAYKQAPKNQATSERHDVEFDVAEG